MRLFIVFFMLLVACTAPLPVTAELVANTSTAPASASVADPYTVNGVLIDMPVASAQEARDSALLAAERQALQKLRDQLSASGNTAAIAEPSDSQLARMVQNFEVANERISAKRYSGNFTIRFRPHTVAQAAPETTQMAEAVVATHSVVALYRFTSLPQWTAMQQRLLQSGVVHSVDLQTIGRGYVKATLNYTGTIDALDNALGAQGLHLQQDTSGWVLTGTQGL